jgi:hypothetical protein
LDFLFYFIFFLKKGFLNVSRANANDLSIYIAQQSHLSAFVKNINLLRTIVSSLVEDYTLPLLDNDSVKSAAEFSDDALLKVKNDLYRRIDELINLENTPVKKRQRRPESIPSNTDANITTMNLQISGSQAHEYLGSSIVLADFTGRNGQRCDLLVGSYGSGRTGGPQEGTAQILFNAACASKDSSGSLF